MSVEEALMKRIKYLESMLDTCWYLCTDDYEEVVARFHESRLKDDSDRLDYMAELLVAVAPAASEVEE